MKRATFEPDYRCLVDAALRKRPRRLPLYEHNVYANVLEALDPDSPGPMAPLLAGDEGDRERFFSWYARRLSAHGYDVVPFEGCVTELVQAGEALCGRAGPLFRDRKDIEEYDWEGFPDRYFERFGPSFLALARSLPAGMKAVAGVGNGLFETVQDFVPLTELAYLEADDPAACDLLWSRVADLLVSIWERFARDYAQAYCLFRSGDDLGFKTSLLIRPDTVRRYVIPAYRRIVRVAHEAGRPFLLHSCGMIFEVMDDLVAGTGIDAKHSNEDAIAPFGRWLEAYGGRIAIFGGVDMDALCRDSPAELAARTVEILAAAAPWPGFAFGSGNQIAEYVPPENFAAMTEAARRFRGE